MDIEAIIDEIVKETKAKGYSFPKQVGEELYDLGGVLTGRKGLEQFCNTVRKSIKGWQQ